MRAELARLLDGNDLWDGRVGILQVTDAVGSVVRVRALVSAKDGPTLFDLRCHVREALVVWLQREHGYGLPRIRLDGGTSPAHQAAPTTAEGTVASENAALFTGSSEARERSRAFTGPSDDELADRAGEPARAG
jgi:hypothetical protein